MDLDKSKRDRILFVLKDSGLSEEEKLKIVDNVSKLAAPLLKAWIRHMLNRQKHTSTQRN